jgi:hypothetical protein
MWTDVDRVRGKASRDRNDHVSSARAASDRPAQFCEEQDEIGGKVRDREGTWLTLRAATGPAGLAPAWAAFSEWKVWREARVVATV